jgi:hypothetical protein
LTQEAVFGLFLTAVFFHGIRGQVEAVCQPAAVAAERPWRWGAEFVVNLPDCIRGGRIEELLRISPEAAAAGQRRAFTKSETVLGIMLREFEADFR